MDLISTRAIDLTKLALDGLMARQKAITANTANVITPGYQRQDVNFENQLKDIITQDNLKKTLKQQNSIQYNPSSLDSIMPSPPRNLTPQEANYLQSNIYNNYNPEIVQDAISGSDSTGNNVNLESEVMKMATVGLKYKMLATLEQKQFKMISSAIKGDIVGS